MTSSDCFPVLSPSARVCGTESDLAVKFASHFIFVLFLFRIGTPLMGTGSDSLDCCHVLPCCEPEPAPPRGDGDLIVYLNIAAA